MPNLTVALELTAQDLMSPELTRALATIREVQAATAELNAEAGGMSPFGTTDITGEATANMAAMGVAAETASGKVATGSREATAALKEHAGAMGALHEEYVGGVAEMAAGFLAFEAVTEVLRKVTEAAREAEVTNRQLGARFGLSAEEYKAFSEQVSRGTNFTAVQFERAASALEPLMRDYGLTDAQLKSLIGTTSDLAAANGIDLVQAANDVAASMRGQARAGVELGLNMRSNVIDNMAGLTAEEKKAALGGDSLAGAQARLHVINIEAAGSLGMAAKAAGDSGDQFARLDKATSNLYETLAKSPVIQGVASDLASAATSAQELILIFEAMDARAERLRSQGGPYTRDENLQMARGNPFLATSTELEQSLGVADWQALAEAHVAAVAALSLNSAQAIGLAGAQPSYMGGSPGVPPQDWRERSVYGNDAQYFLNAGGQRAGERGDALVELHRYQDALRQASVDGGDLFTRHTQGWQDVASAITDAAQQMSMYDLQMKDLQQHRGVESGLIGTLEAARTLERRMGTYHGEYDAAVLGLKVRQNRDILAEGQAALARYGAGLAAEAAGGDFYDVLKTNAIHTDAIIVNGQGAGQQSDIGGQGQAATSAAGGSRYDGARSTGPAYQSGLGRFGQ